MKIGDLYKSDLARSWHIVDASTLSEEVQLDADVVIIGSGAGGGLAAEIFSRAGHRVILVEEGALNTSSNFDLDELNAYTRLYQDGLTRSTVDGAIAIMQGQTVGGGTTVNWTASFRTPSQTLEHWRADWGLAELSDAVLDPWFDIVEKRLSIAPWLSPNANNDALRQGCEALSWHWAPIPRNVKGCWNLGYCGLGCPTNAKQSMLVTAIPAALAHGATLVHRLRVHELLIADGKVDGVLAKAQNAAGTAVRLKAKHYILAAGAIGTPSILLRSAALPDPYALVGQRTFLHPTVFAYGVMPKDIEGFRGAPQSIYCDHFQWLDGVSGPMGYKIEASGLHPAFAAVGMRGAGSRHREKMLALPHSCSLIALLRDGFHEESAGGTVDVADNGSALIDYPLTPYLFNGVRRAYLSMAELLFAAGARGVHVGHSDSAIYKSWAEAKQQIAALDLEPLLFRLGSAHVMGGCPMGSDDRRSVVNTKGQHHQLENLYICDGSLFPTSIGANPQLSIYAMAARIAHGIIGDGKVHFDPAVGGISAAVP